MPSTIPVEIQVVRAAELSEEAQGRRSTTVTEYGARGDIVDANGVENVRDWVGNYFRTFQNVRTDFRTIEQLGNQLFVREREPEVLAALMRHLTGRFCGAPGEPARAA